MTEDDRNIDLDSQEGQPLPDRELMSIITPEPQPWPAAEGGAEQQPVEEAPTGREPLGGPEPT
jgi:hypothetical protein